MIPKKRILIIDPIEQRQAVLRFLLLTHGYAVISASDAEGALARFAEAPPDLAVTTYKLVGMQKMLDDFRVLDAFTPSLVLAPGCSTQPAALISDAVLWGAQCTATEILQQVKLMSRRKRGPRPAVKKSPQSASLDVAADRRSA